MFEIVEFERSEGAVLEDLPIAVDVGLDGLAAILDAAFATDEVVIAWRFRAGLADECGHEADAVDARGWLHASDFADGGEDVHGQRGAGGADAGLDVAGPASGTGHADAAFIHVGFATAPRTVVRAGGEEAAVVGAEDDEGVVAQFQLIKPGHDAADAVIHVLDECDDLRAFLGDAGLALFHFLKPVRRGLDGIVGRVVGEVEEEGLLLGSALGEVVAGPSCEEVGGVFFGLDHFLIAPHEVLAVPQVGPVVVHHVAEEAVEEVETALGGCVR